MVEEYLLALCGIERLFFIRIMAIKISWQSGTQKAILKFLDCELKTKKNILYLASG
jgi:hypothetical protein